MYSFGNGSGVGKGTTEPRQHSPWLIEPLESEMVIDISTGDGHCLALTQSEDNILTYCIIVITISLHPSLYLSLFLPLPFLSLSLSLSLPPSLPSSNPTLRRRGLCLGHKQHGSVWPRTQQRLYSHSFKSSWS